MNLFDLPALPISEELTTILANNKNIRIERILSTGQTTGWYDQSETEFVILIQGNARIEYDNGEKITLAKGDTLLLKPHQRHRVTYTSSQPACIWLCIFWG